MPADRERQTATHGPNGGDRADFALDALEHVRDAIMIVRADDGILIYVNERACEHLGYPRGELIGRPIAEVSETFLDTSWSARAAMYRREGGLISEIIHRRKDGSTVPVEVNVRYVESDKGDYVVSSVRDISERKEAEAKPHESFAKEKEAQKVIRRIFDTNPDVLYVYDLDEERSIFENRHVADAIGYTAEQISAMGNNLVLNLAHPDDRERLARQFEDLKRAADGEILSVEYRVRHSGMAPIAGSRGATPCSSARLMGT